MGSAALHLSFLLILSLLPSTEARSLRSTEVKKVSRDGEKSFNPMKTSENQLLHVELLERVENHLSTMFKLWEKGGVDRSEDQSELLAKTSLAGFVGLVVFD